jgi:D-sedoheptulose 7-phosphate isomerase
MKPRLLSVPPQSASKPQLSFAEHINELVTESFDVKCRFFGSATEQIARSAQIIVDAMRIGGKLLLFGNGGSAADAQRLASELAFKMERNRPALPAMALTTDTSLLTAISDDGAYQYVFSRQIAALGRAGDVAMAISANGNSPNVIEAIRQARRMNISTIGLLGGEDGGRAAEMVDVALIVPSASAARIQEVHIEVGNILGRLIEDSMFPQ